MKLYVINGYSDQKIRVGLLEKEWKSKNGTPLVTLKILDHYKEHETVYRTYHRDKLTVAKVLDVDETEIAQKEKKWKLKIDLLQQNNL